MPGKSPSNRKHTPVTFECPNCGASVPTDALACPDCGSDAETGWSDDTMYDGLDLPDEAFGDDDDVSPSAGDRPVWKVVAVVLLVAIVLLVLAGLW